MHINLKGKTAGDLRASTILSEEILIAVSRKFDGWFSDFKGGMFPDEQERSLQAVCVHVLDPAISPYTAKEPEDLFQCIYGQRLAFVRLMRNCDEIARQQARITWRRGKSSDVFYEQNPFVRDEIGNGVGLIELGVVIGVCGLGPKNDLQAGNAFLEYLFQFCKLRRANNRVLD